MERHSSEPTVTVTDEVPNANKSFLCGILSRNQVPLEFYSGREEGKHPPCISTSQSSFRETNHSSFIFIIIHYPSFCLLETLPKFS